MAQRALHDMAEAAHHPDTEATHSAMMELLLSCLNYVLPAWADFKRVGSYAFSVCIEIYCEALRTSDYIRDFDVYQKHRLLNRTSPEWQPVPHAVFCLHLCPDTAYLYRTSMRTIILLIKPISFEPWHSMLVLAITIGNIKSHPSQRTVHFTNREKPETWVSPCYTYSKEQWPYLPHPYPADVN